MDKKAQYKKYNDNKRDKKIAKRNEMMYYEQSIMLENERAKNVEKADKLHKDVITFLTLKEENEQTVIFSTLILRYELNLYLFSSLMMMYVKRFPDVLKTYNFCRSREKLSSREV
jgi:hypothetical protein